MTRSALSPRGLPMFAGRKTLAAALCLALVACGGKHAANDAFDGGTSSFALSLVGGANLVVHPGEKRTLQVLLTQDQVGPVGNGKVHFEFQDGDPVGAKIDANDVQTDASGTATIHFTAGTSANKPPFKLVASAPNYGSDPVAFSFSVIPVRRLLQIIVSANTHVGTDGTTATTTLGVPPGPALKVKGLDADTGASIAGDGILFLLPPAANSKWSGGTSKSLTVPTGAGGEAQAFLLTTQAAEPSFPVTVQSNAGGAAVTFNVTVQSGSGSSCTTNAQCGPGMVCIGNPPTCQPGGGGTSCGTGDNSCPFGYTCDPNTGVCTPPNGAQCTPAAPHRTSGYCCASDNTCKPDCATPCTTGQHCLPAPTSRTGSCVADATTPDVTGLWLTKHDYNLP